MKVASRPSPRMATIPSSILTLAGRCPSGTRSRSAYPTERTPNDGVSGNLVRIDGFDIMAEGVKRPIDIPGKRK